MFLVILNLIYLLLKMYIHSKIIVSFIFECKINPFLDSALAEVEFVSFIELFNIFGN